MPTAADVGAALEGLAAQLSAAGLRTSLDRAKVNPPGALIAPGTWNEQTMGGGGFLRAEVFLIVGDSQGDGGTFAALWGLLEQALTVVTAEEPVDLSYAVALPHSQTPFPAFRLLVDVAL